MIFGGITDEKYSNFNDSRVVIFPVSYNTGESTSAIISASQNLELYEEETDGEVYKIGIHTLKEFIPLQTPELIMPALYKQSKELISSNKFISTIGGEHSISVPIIQAHAEKYYDLSVLQIDAYPNLCDEEKFSYSRDSVMSQVIKKMLIPAVQVGIRSISAEEIITLDENLPTKIFWAKNIAGNTHWIEDVVKSLTQNVYLTIDISGFDSSLISSMRNPQPGGLGWYETLALIHKVSEKRRIVGIDLVEYISFKGQYSSAFFCAKLIYKSLAYIFKEITPKVRKVSLLK